jgi:hypothetical protein
MPPPRLKVNPGESVQSPENEPELKKAPQTRNPLLP